jgi:hypothetical protein
LWLEHLPGAGGVVQIGARRSKTYGLFVIRPDGAAAGWKT